MKSQKNANKTEFVKISQNTPLFLVNRSHRKMAVIFAQNILKTHNLRPFFAKKATYGGVYFE